MLPRDVSQTYSLDDTESMCSIPECTDEKWLKREM